MDLPTFWDNFEVIAEAPGGVQRLRELILDLAVRGKLVPQDPADEPAAKLKERIKSHFQDLILNKKIKKPKALPPIDNDELPFSKPIQWEWCRLGEIIRVSSGKNLPSKKMAEDGEIPVFGGNGITGHHDESNVHAETLVIGRVGFYCGSVHITPEKAWVTDNAFITTFLKDAIDIQFLYWLLCHTDLQQNNSATAQPVISGGKIYPILVPLPPLSEQKRIVAKVDELMALCDRYEVLKCDRNTLRTKMRASAIDALMNATTDESLNTAWEFVRDNWECLCQQPEDVEGIRLSVSQLAVQGRLTEQNDSDGLANMLLSEVRTQIDELIQKKIIKKIVVEQIFPDKQPHLLPLSWEWIRLGSILSSLRYGTSKKCGYDTVGSPVLRIPNIQIADGCLNIQDLKFAVLTDKERKDLQVQPGDLLMIRSNGSKALVGRTAVVMDEENGYAYAGYLVRLRPFPGSCDAIYLNLAIGSVTTRQQIEYPIRTTSGVKNINSKEIANLLLPLPPLAEQKRIVAKVDQLMPLCDTLETHLHETQEKATALAAAVVGQLEV